MEGVNVFTIEKNTLLCNVDYYGKLPVMKKTDSLSADSLIRVVKIVFAKFELPKQIVSDAGMNFI